MTDGSCQKSHVAAGAGRMLEFLCYPISPRGALGDLRNQARGSTIFGALSNHITPDLLAAWGTPHHAPEPHHLALSVTWCSISRFWRLLESPANWHAKPQLWGFYMVFEGGFVGFWSFCDCQLDSPANWHPIPTELHTHLVLCVTQHRVGHFQHPIPHFKVLSVD